MKKLWEEIKEKCLTNANKCLETGSSEEAERLLTMALWIHNAIEPSELQPGEEFESTDYVDEKVNAQKEQIKILEQLATPIVDWLRENYDPYTTLIITDIGARMEQMQMSVPFPIPD